VNLTRRQVLLLSLELEGYQLWGVELFSHKPHLQ
jgi:hypothetical protein